jgi:hypothetical protein
MSLIEKLQELKEEKAFVAIRSVDECDYVGEVAEIRENHILLKPVNKPVPFGLFGWGHQPPQYGLKIAIGAIEKVSKIVDGKLVEVT